MNTPAPQGSSPRHNHRRRDLAVAFVLGGFAAMACAGIGALVVIESGLFNATATTPHLRIVGWAAHSAFIHSVRVRSGDVQAPARFSEAEVTAGFHRYDADCAMCHGAPGVPRAPWVRGMTPTPPFLLDAARRWTPAQLYWIVGRGIKMTAMPAWSETRSDGQIWDTVAFLEALPRLSPADYARMKAADIQAATPTSSTAIKALGPRQ
jgi:mono/diheme cytochrome c family protein